MRIFSAGLGGASVNTKQLAKAWVRWDASTGTPVINASYGVSSLTDISGGSVGINFTTAFAAANSYAFVVGGSDLDADGRFLFNDTDAPTASALRIVTTNSAQSPADTTHASVVIFGDL